MISFYYAVLNQNNRPDYYWEITDDYIYVKVDPDNGPSVIKLWQANNPETRDFRIDLVGEIWKDSTLTQNPEGIYRVNITSPEKGWKAYFVELTYPGDIPLKITTGIKVLPGIYPFDPFVADFPKGSTVLP
jgi:PhoPQ-activated pathogenicity-related protein